LPPTRADRNGQNDDAGTPDVGKNHDLADSSVPVTTTRPRYLDGAHATLLASRTKNSGAEAPEPLKRRKPASRSSEPKPLL
jgi:hypothetical protein